MMPILSGDPDLELPDHPLGRLHLSGLPARLLSPSSRGALLPQGEVMRPPGLGLVQVFRRPGPPWD